MSSLMFILFVCGTKQLTTVLRFLPPQPAVINRHQDCILNEQIVDVSNNFDLRFLIRVLLLITNRNQTIEKRKGRQIMMSNNSMTGLIRTLF